MNPDFRYMYLSLNLPVCMYGKCRRGLKIFWIITIQFQKDFSNRFLLFTICVIIRLKIFLIEFQIYLIVYFIMPNRIWRKKLYTIYLELLRMHTYIYVKSICSEIKRKRNRNEKQIQFKNNFREKNFRFR